MEQEQYLSNANMDRFIDIDKVVGLAKQIGDVLSNQTFPEAIMALSIAIQCTVEDGFQEDKQIEIVSSLMGKVISGIVNTRLKKTEEPKYEFRNIAAGRGGGLTPSSLKEMEADGWELVGQNGLEYNFRRKMK